MLTDKIDASGRFSVVLSSPLIEALRLTATACAEGGKACTDSEARVVVDPGDWGRVRAYFTGGVVFSKGHDDFSQQDMLLAFVVDKSWLQARPYEVTDDTVAPSGIEGEAGRAQARKATEGGALSPRSLNTVFDARLTSVPVAATNKTAPAAAPAGTALDQFISSKKAALVQAGLYVPVYGRWTSWRHQGIPNALFIAPVARGGIQTLTGDDKTAEGEALGGDDVFNFFSFGLALGHYKLSDSINRAPELISYLHITRGRSEAFEIAPDKDHPELRERPWRTVVEGRLKIPETPLQIGFDANLGDGPDDVRFSFATRFDVGELFGKLKSF